MHLIYRNTCRVCGSPHLSKVIDLGEQFLQNMFVKPDMPHPPTRKIPMIILRCDPTRDEKACGLLQLAHSVPPAILYSSYWYRSGTNNTMKNHLKNIAEEASLIVPKKRATVLDIGCNDGTLLSFYPSRYKKFGIDPSNAIEEVKLKNTTLVKDVFPSIELEQRSQEVRFDIITSIAMFYDLDNPVDFARHVKTHLSSKGLWIFEMYYMPNMLRQNCYDTICHEHLEYYSLAVIEYILRESGMKLIKANLNNINGGSIRCYATPLDNFSFNNYEDTRLINNLRKKEFDLELDTDKPYKTFQKKIFKLKKELYTLLSKLKKQGKRIHTYGASTKGNTILQFCHIDNSIIEYAADRNPAKYGATTLGTNIPIISEEQSRAMNPDYYLVLPWSFRDEFLTREKKILDRGVGMIFPFPRIEIVKKK